MSKYPTSKAEIDAGMESKFLVINAEDAIAYLSVTERERLASILHTIGRGRRLAGKGQNTYMVVNTDEPYAADVAKVLIDNGHWGVREVTKIIAIEGIDGSGKYTQAQRLVTSLKDMGYNVVFQDFPNYAGPIGRLIKEVLCGEESLTETALHLLFEVDRIQFWNKYTASILAADFVVMDRWTLSNLAFAREKGLNTVPLRRLQQQLPVPDMTFFLDIPVKESFDRRPLRRDKHETDVHLLSQVRMRYQYLMKELNDDDHLAVTVDGTQSIDDIHMELLAHVNLAFLTPELVDQPTRGRLG